MIYFPSKSEKSNFPISKSEYPLFRVRSRKKKHFVALLRFCTISNFEVFAIILSPFLWVVGEVKKSID